MPDTCRNSFDMRQQRVTPRRVHLKHALRYSALLRVDFNGTRGLVIAVSIGGTPWVRTLFGLLVHALFDFFAQIL